MVGNVESSVDSRTCIVAIRMRMAEDRLSAQQQVEGDRGQSGATERQQEPEDSEAEHPVGHRASGGRSPRPALLISASHGGSDQAAAAP